MGPSGSTARSTRAPMSRKCLGWALVSGSKTRLNLVLLILAAVVAWGRFGPYAC